MTSQRYRNEVLEPYFSHFRGAYGSDFLFMDDNASPHQAHFSDDYLESEVIEKKPWTAKSPDLNPMENLWDYLEKVIARRHSLPRDGNELKTAFLKEFNLIPQIVVTNVFASMKTRRDMC